MCRTRRAGVQRSFGIGIHHWPKDWIRRSEKWEEMDSETQGLWRKLGWNSSDWNVGKSPEVSRRKWADLTAEEQKAAAQLGYARDLWDAEDKTLCAADSKGKQKKRKNIYPGFDDPSARHSIY